METNEKKQGKDLVVEDGHPASFRHVDGSMKNIYSDDGNLTDEGKTITLLRETLSKETHASRKAEKTSKRKGKRMIWAVSAGVIILFLLFFHISFVTAYEWSGLPMIYPKATPTFSNTFITPNKVNDVLKRYNNASVFERMSIENEPFVKLLFEKGILYDKKNVDVNLDATVTDISKQVQEQTENYKYYFNGKSGGWKDFNVKIIFGKKEIKIVGPQKTHTFIIVEITENEYNSEDGSYHTRYNVYYSNDVNKNIVYIFKSNYGETSIVTENSYECFSNQNYQ